jgi:hypothetical protein
LKMVELEPGVVRGDDVGGGNPLKTKPWQAVRSNPKGHAARNEDDGISFMASEEAEVERRFIYSAREGAVWPVHRKQQTWKHPRMPAHG